MLLFLQVICSRNNWFHIMMMQRVNGDTEVELTHDDYVSTPLERFLTRLLRREIINALSQQKHNPNEKYLMELFGSSVPQLYRPIEGYPIPRLGRDIDLGIVMKSPLDRMGKTVRPSAAEQEEFGQYIVKAIELAGAKIVEGSVKGTAGYDGLKITKTYSPEQLKPFMKNKWELKGVELPDRPIRVPLEISPVFERCQNIPIVPYGKNGLYHEPLLAVMGRKLHRMTSPERPVHSDKRIDATFEIKDVMDMYNVIVSGNLNVEKNKDVLRAIALVAMAESPDAPHTLDNLLPNESNIGKAAKIMGLDEVKMQKVYTTVYDAVRTVFPPDRSQLPPQKAGPLGFTLDEYNFFMGLEGLSHRLESPNPISITPRILAGNIVSSELEAKCPGLRRSIETNCLLNNIVRDAQQQRQVLDF